MHVMGGGGDPLLRYPPPTTHYPLSIFFSNSCTLFRALLHSFASSKDATGLFSCHSALFAKNRGVGYPPPKPSDKFEPPPCAFDATETLQESKKAPRCNREASLAKLFAQPLEDDFNRELHVERFPRAQRLEAEFDRQLDLERLARTQPWCGLGVRDGVLHPTEAPGRVAADQTTIQGDVGTAAVDAAKDGGQVFAVENVEHLGAELGLDPFRDGHVLDHRHVHTAKARSVELVAAEVAATG